jgi:hypothetical protein
MSTPRCRATAPRISAPRTLAGRSPGARQPVGQTVIALLRYSARGAQLG